MCAVDKSNGEILRFWASPTNCVGPMVFVFACAGAIAVYWVGLASLAEAWTLPEYSHGPVIPLLSLYMFLREMKAVPQVEDPVTDRWPGACVIVLALMIGVFGNLVRIPDVITYGFILWIGGMVLLAFGWRRGRIFWPSVLHLVFMLPLPQVIYWQMSVLLQSVSSEIGVAVILSMGIPVYLDGNVIDLGSYKLLVAEACSGLRYLFPIMSFSYVFAVLYSGPAWHKAVLLLSAAPITVLMNAFRIGMIGVLVENKGIEHAEGFLHTFEGWVIFVACIGILFGLAMLMQRFQRNRAGLRDSIDLDFRGLDAQLRRFFAILPSPALICVAAAMVAVTAALHLTPERSPTPISREPLALFPLEVDTWQGWSTRLDPQVEAVLGADDYVSATFANPDVSAPIDLFIAYYEKQTEGAAIHSPAVCIPVDGWEVSTWQQTEIAPRGLSPFSVNRAVIQKGLDRQLVYYWFEQRGRRLTNDHVAKIYTVWDGALYGRTDGALVRLVTPIWPDDSEDDADARLRSFVRSILPDLPRYVPGGPDRAELG